MQRIFIVGILIAASMSTTAWAESCSGYAAICARNEGKMGLPASRCEGPRRACLAACKAGKQGIFLSPSRKIPFQATECS
jgi:hypothetical protein